MNRTQLARIRLSNQQIATPRFATAGEVVAALCAMQAQDYAGALWSIGLRLPAATQADVEQAIADHTILRTWPLRGTLHFVAAADVHWILELLGRRAAAGRAGRLRQLDLDDAVLEQSKEVIVRALEGGRQLSRGALFAELEAAGIATTGQRGYHILGHWAQHGLLCFGVHEGKQPTFVLLAEWAPDARRLERDEALGELAARYFTGHGPASLYDFVWWSGLTRTDARTGIALAAARLVQVECEGVDYWMAPHVSPRLAAESLDRESAGAASRVCLLPGFDEYLLGYTDRSAMLDPLHASKIAPGSNGIFQPTIVIDGRIAGTWKRTLNRTAVQVDIALFDATDEVETAHIAAAAARYGHFLGRTVSIQE